MEKATGKVAVTDYVAVHDVGKVVNRMSIEGQLHGGIHMGMGYALCEGLSFDEEGRSRNDSFVTNPILRSHQMPRIQVDFIEETEPTGPLASMEQIRPLGMVLRTTLAYTIPGRTISLAYTRRPWPPPPTCSAGATPPPGSSTSALRRRPPWPPTTPAIPDSCRR
mgnify:CR=1 FL=1